MATYEFLPGHNHELSLDLVQRSWLIAKVNKLPQREVAIHEEANGWLRITDLADAELEAIWATYSVRAPDFKPDTSVLPELQNHQTVTYPARLERTGNVDLVGRARRLHIDTVLPDPKFFSLHNGLRAIIKWGLGGEVLNTAERLQQEIAEIVEANLVAVHGLNDALINRWLERL